MRRVTHIPGMDKHQERKLIKQKKMNENDDDFLNLKTIPVKESWADSLPLTMNNTGKQV